MLQKKHILIFAIPGGIILLLVLTLIVFQIVKGGPKNSTVPNSTTIEDSETQPQRVSEIPLYTQFGQPMKIGLYANPTTGYSWSADFDTGFFKLNDSYYIAKGDENVVGSGGTQYFEFEILKTGNSDIRFEYKKPWEHDVQPEQVTTYKVNVSEVAIE